jgi:D-psicose/D-tagatose/L-ribulose 3-epimerase
MKCGITTYIWAADFTAETFRLLPDLRAWGFDGIELPIFRPEGFPAAAVRRELEARGLACNTSIALIPGLSLITGDSAVRGRTLQHVADIIKAAADTGSTRLLGPVYSPVGELPGRRRTADEWQRAVDAYQELTPTLDACGVTLGIEPLNRFETSFLNTVADGLALCDAVGHPRVGLLFDTFHANIEEKRVGAALRAAARHLKYIHISENDRGTPGTGHVDWPDVFRAIREIGYDEWLTIEGFGFSLGDLSVAAAIWRDIEPTPDAIARDGVRFVREQLG